MKNICFYLTRYPGYGGIETVTSVIVEKLHELHPELNIIIVSHLCQEVKFKINDDIKIYHLPNWDKWPHNYRYDSEDIRTKLLDILRSENIETIFYLDSYAPSEKVVCEAANIIKAKLFVFEHNTPLFHIQEYRNRQKHSLKNYIGYLYVKYRTFKRKRYLYKNCDKYIVLAKAYIDEFCKLNNIKDKTKITYLNNPLNASASDISYDKKDSVILFVGRLNTVKRVDLMLYAWNKIAASHKSWKFVCVGDGPERQNLENIVQTQNIPRVEFCGFQDPKNYYGSSKIFWMTSSFEGWPMTLGETMQNGCVPVVYNSFSSVSDIIDDGKNGYVVKDKDEESFINKTVKLMDDECLLRSFAENGLEKVKEFKTDVIIKDWENLILK